MQAWKDSIVIHAPVDRVFAYVDDSMTLVDWIPGLMDIRDVRGSGKGQQHEWTYKMVGVKLRGQAVVVEHVPNECAAHQLIGMIHSTFTYAVKAHDEGTLLTVDVEYHIPVPVLGKLAERIIVRQNARELELALVNVKDVMEQ